MKKQDIVKPQGKEFFISKKVDKAITDYNMIDDGERIAVVQIKIPQGGLSWRN